MLLTKMSAISLTASRKRSFNRRSLILTCMGTAAYAVFAIAEGGKVTSLTNSAFVNMHKLNSASSVA